MAKILVVDDEPALVSTLGYTLRRDGHEVLTAGDGLRALDLARRERPDVIVLDLLLPELDGLDVCRAIRRSPSFPLRAVPILMLSARVDEVDKVVALELGADDYVTKPFALRELLARVRALLCRVRRAAEAANAVAFFAPSAEIKRFANRSGWRGRARLPKYPRCSADSGNGTWTARTSSAPPMGRPPPASSPAEEGPRRVPGRRLTRRPKGAP